MIIKSIGSPFRREEEEEEQEQQELDASSDEELDPFTEDIIDALPDPDEVYGEKDDPSSSDESQSEKDEEEDDEVQEPFSPAISRGKKRPLKGKKLAQFNYKEAKRAKLEKNNQLSAISAEEKENLALFLLKNKK